MIAGAVRCRFGGVGARPVRVWGTAMIEDDDDTRPTAAEVVLWVAVLVCLCVLVVATWEQSGGR